METQWQEIIALLQRGKTQLAREKLGALRGQVAPEEEWRLHELYGAVFHDLADPEGAAAAYSNAAQCDKYIIPITSLPCIICRDLVRKI